MTEYRRLSTLSAQEITALGLKCYNVRSVTSHLFEIPTALQRDPDVTRLVDQLAKYNDVDLHVYAASAEGILLSGVTQSGEGAFLVARHFKFPQEAIKLEDAMEYTLLPLGQWDEIIVGANNLPGEKQVIPVLAIVNDLVVGINADRAADCAARAREARAAKAASK